MIKKLVVPLVISLGCTFSAASLALSSGGVSSSSGWIGSSSGLIGSSSGFGSSGSSGSFGTSSGFLGGSSGLVGSSSGGLGSSSGWLGGSSGWLGGSSGWTGGSSGLLGGSSGFLGGGSGTGSGGEGYAANGGEAVTSESGGSACTVYRPTTLEGDHPVIVWGNGTGAPVSSYAQLLRHWASWNFIVIAANTSSAGNGQAMRSCLDWLASSPLGANADMSRVGASGHSQGGGGAIMAGTDPRVITTAPIEGASIGLGASRTAWTQQTGPMLILSGGSDTIVSPSTFHAPLFSQLDVPAFWATLSGASHFEPVGDGGGFKGISTAWFMFQLRGDGEAAAEFVGDNCGFCNASGWSVQRKGL